MFYLVQHNYVSIEHASFPKLYARLSLPSHETKTGFSGLPAQWEAILRSSSLTKSDPIEHPNEVIEILNLTGV